MTADEIHVKLEMILEANQHWKSCQDGSYEMALSYAGYYEIKAQLDKLVQEEK